MSRERSQGQNLEIAPTLKKKAKEEKPKKRKQRKWSIKEKGNKKRIISQMKNKSFKIHTGTLLVLYIVIGTNVTGIKTTTLKALQSSECQKPRIPGIYFAR